MRKIALVISIIGIGALLALLFSQPKEVNSLENLKAGTLVSVKGIVSEEKDLSFGKTFLIKQIPIFCECKESYEKKEVLVIGIVENYYELRVRVLEIKEIDAVSNE